MAQEIGSGGGDWLPPNMTDPADFRTGKALFDRMKVGQPYLKHQEEEKSIAIMRVAAQYLGITGATIMNGEVGPFLLQRAIESGRTPVKRSEGASSMMKSGERGVYCWCMESVQQHKMVDACQQVVNDRTANAGACNFSPGSAQFKLTEVCPPSNSRDLSTHSHDRLLACMSIIQIPC